ncbi:hypothetical protein QW71_02760 [Paenibacillus sp. IHB B 3415]|uniref:tetratricopeptide repeat protein n=1 Tax=Paenibacillus sp. IHB B 3415 TaxID=867080 RepID=UPI00057460CD|nr:hypothetical protein [Paenibacillus sp. IHB B 3415]KHL97107.1 hypothetical protein QW71_02760 [Paenibacillus sp. IHB B 3415]
MEPVVLARIGAKFFAYVLPRIKNSKVYRDIQAKWSKDNYSTQVKNMFKAAIADSKAVFDIPDELINELLEDKINRDEIFRWILEGVTMEDFESSKLNLLPYIERYPQYEDYLEAFFVTILDKVDDFQEHHWNPEFLQILSHIRSMNLELKEEIKQGFDRMETAQGQFSQTLNEQNTLLNNLFEPVSFTDLNELIIAGDVISARERAFERLRGKKVYTDYELMELNAVIGSSFIMNGEEKESIIYLQTAVYHCKDEPRKYRMLSLVKFFEDHYEEALEYMNRAIELEGYTQNNIEKIVNIYRRQGQLDLALELLDKYPDFELEELRAYTLIGKQQYATAISLVQKMLVSEPENFTWQLIWLETKISELQEQISSGNIFDIEEIYQSIMLTIKKLENQKKQSKRIHARINELKAAISYWSKRFTEAKLIYEELYTQTQNEFYYKNLLYCCLCDEDYDRSIHLLEDQIKNNDNDIENIIILGIVYLDSGEPLLAKNLLEMNMMHVDDQNSSSIKYYFVYIRSLYNTLNFPDINSFIASLEVKQNDQMGTKALKAYSYTLLHDWETAIFHWESCIDSLSKDLYIDAAMYLSQAYLNRGTKYDYEQMVKLIENIPNWKQHEQMINTYATGLYELKEYEKTIKLFKELPSTNLDLLAIVNTIYFNFEWYETAKENYMALYQKTNNIIFLTRYASCLFRLGSTKECLDVLHSIEQRIKEKPTIEHLQLLSISYLEAKYHHKSMEFAFKLFNIGKLDPDVWSFYFFHFQHIARQIELLPEWIETFQFIWENFNINFPAEEPLYQTITALNDDDTLSDQLIKVLKDNHDSQQRTRQMIKDNYFPPSFMASMLNKGPYETWIHHCFSPDLEFWIYYGYNISEFISHGIQISKTSTSVLCDLYNLLTVRHLGLLNELAGMYELYIHQNEYNELFNEYSNKKAVSTQGLSTLSYSDGQINLMENTADEVQQYLKGQEEFISWINTSCIKIGNKITNDETDDKMDFLFQPLAICSEKSLNMMIDSHLVRSLAKELHNVETFNTLEWVEILRITNKITKEQYYDYLGELIYMGYSLFPINEHIILHQLKKSSYLLNDKTLQLINYLKKDDIKHEYVLGVSAQILKEIWLENLPTFQRQIITDTLCNVVSHNKNKQESILKLLEETRPLFSILVEMHYKKLETAVSYWLQGQQII